MGQADRQREQGVQMVFTCTAPPISLRVYLLAVAARETRFRARGCSVDEKEREGGGGWTLMSRSPFLTCMPKKSSSMQRAARHVLVCQSMRQSHQKKENPELLTS
jgi:hypothetical protein